MAGDVDPSNNFVTISVDFNASVMHYFEFPDGCDLDLREITLENDQLDYEFIRREQSQ